MHIFDCTGRNGESCEFQFSINAGNNGMYTVKVTTVPPLANGEFFELILVELDDDPSVLRVDVMTHHYTPEYMAKGIPQGVLPELKKALQKGVQSSPGLDPNNGKVRRNEAATKAWQRLVELGGAEYSHREDIFRVL